MRLTARSLTVRGSLARTATGRAALTYEVVVRHRHVRVRKATRVRHGAFTATLRLAAQARRARSGTLTVRYSGDWRYESGTIERRLKRSAR